MRYKRALIDSLNLADTSMESIFIHNKDDYTIEAVKTKSVFNPLVWRKAFGSSLTRNIIEAKIIHTYLGLEIPLKTFAPTPQSQTVEFAGLQGYNERSKFLLQHLRELESRLQYTRVMRMDISIDFKHGIPKRVIKHLSKHREPFQCKNTTYWKTAKEKKTNRVMDIKIYNKALHAKLDEPLYRLEFCFKSEYLKKLLFKDTKSIYNKMEKTIKKATGMNVKINDLF